MGARNKNVLGYHIDRASVRTAAPVIGPLHSEFYHGTRVLEDQNGCFKIIKNVCVTPIVSIVDQELVLSDELFDAARLSIKLRPPIPVAIDQTFRYQFAPGDNSFLHDKSYSFNIKSYERIAMRFCKAHRCDFLYPHKLVAIDMPLAKQGGLDSLSCKIPQLPEEGGFGGQFDLFPDDIQRFGVVRVLGIVVSPEVWEVIGKHLKFPYFLVHKIDDQGHAERVALSPTT